MMSPRPRGPVTRVLIKCVSLGSVSVPTRRSFMSTPETAGLLLDRSPGLFEPRGVDLSQHTPVTVGISVPHTKAPEVPPKAEPKPCTRPEGFSAGELGET